MMKIIIFGVSQVFQNKKKQIHSNIETVVYIDNNPVLQGKYIDGIPIVSPNDIHKYSYDKILLMCQKENIEVMKRQLIELDVDAKKIYCWDEFYDEMQCGVTKFYCGNDRIIENGKKILVISTDLNYDGGSLVIVYTVKSLQSHGYNVVLAAPEGTQRFIDETVNQGINVIICPSLNYLHKEELFWIQQFDIVLVNVFQMIQCASEISKVKPVLWWIHEPSDLFETVIEKNSKYMYLERILKANIYAVSRISQKNFNYYFPGRVNKILDFGIPDDNGRKISTNDNEKMIFAVIGAIIPRKAQDIFLQAISLMKEQNKKNVEFWLIGAIWESEYGNRIKNYTLNEPAVKILGELTREEIHKRYEEIDVVVCPSIEEPMSIAVMEGMMYGKICVVSDVVGMAAYIKEEKNGLICKTGDAVSLAKKMEWIVEHKDKLYHIRKNARETYEEHFTMEKFGEKLERAIKDTIQNFFEEEIIDNG